jgi:hypothetical protein
MTTIGHIMDNTVLSTYKILMNKAFNQDIDESWIDWAMEMIEAGFQSDNLYILAGMTKPFNQFELQELTNNVIRDLHLDYDDKDTVIRNYVYFIITNGINNPDSYLKVLRELKDICIGLGMEKEYIDFYLLYFAKDDLTESENQWYWDGATRENIDEIIKSQFIKWKTEYERRKTTA